MTWVNLAHHREQMRPRQDGQIDADAIPFGLRDVRCFQSLAVESTVPVITADVFSVPSRTVSEYILRRTQADNMIVDCPLPERHPVTPLSACGKVTQTLALVRASCPLSL